ncbi:DinB family protein [Erythrobacter sp. JK5]|uniref:DinB family protein n=1 Tax=Erythrobacter sp. JK5 TaxID=2829500 RepID=UPI001BA72E90|nr:DinB family protein [Erythrobacter sp. JK5]QUL37628.1 DinB family protein [Erythrobacter sp. JK5]
MSESTNAIPLNDVCPWSGNPVSADALTSYRGSTVGFCNPDCRDKFAAAVAMFDPRIARCGEGQPTSAFVRLAQYNSWMNGNLLDALAKLSGDQLWEDRGAFFKSIMGTMNHLMVWDITWLQRFERQFGFRILSPVAEMHSPTANDEVLHRGLGEFANARLHLDGLLFAFVSEVDPAHLEDTLEYAISNGTRFRKNCGAVLQHLFNHQTHHRGQVTTLLSQFGVDPGTTDLLAILPEVPSA